LPPFSVNRTTGNTTVVLGFSDICLELGAAIGLIPLIAILEQVAIAKAFGIVINTSEGVSHTKTDNIKKWNLF
jgi:hypothetical protein